MSSTDIQIPVTNKAFIYSKSSTSAFPAFRWVVIDQNVEEMYIMKCRIRNIVN